MKTETNQCDTVKTPEINSHICGQLMKKIPKINTGEGTGFLISDAMKIEYPHAKQKYSYLTICSKINSKLIKDLNIRPETIKFLEKTHWY
jgi:hypothetical protein